MVKYAIPFFHAVCKLYDWFVDAIAKDLPASPSPHPPRFFFETSLWQSCDNTQKGYLAR